MLRNSLVGRAIVVTGWLVAAAGCERRATPVPTASAPQPRRFLTDRVDTTWAYVVPESTIVSPTFLTMDSTQVYLADAGPGVLRAYDRRTGQRRWERTIGANGIRLATGRRAGGVAYVDERSGAIELLAQSGEPAGRIASPDVTSAGAFCELPDGAYLLAGVNHTPSLMTVDTRGHVRRALTLPWRDLQDVVRSQVWLAPTPTGCIASLTYGRGFTAFAGDSFSAPVRYVEYFDVPALEREVRKHADSTITSTGVAEHRIAAVDASVDDSTLAVSFDGTTDVRGHVIDFYAIGDGRYLGSRRLARRPMVYAQRGGLAVALTRVPGGYQLAAWRERAGR